MSIYKLNITTVGELLEINSYSISSDSFENLNTVVDELIEHEVEGQHWEVELLRNGYPYMFASKSHPSWAALDEGLAAYAMRHDHTTPEGPLSEPKPYVPPPTNDYSPRRVVSKVLAKREAEMGFWGRLRRELQKLYRKLTMRLSYIFSSRSLGE